MGDSPSQPRAKRRKVDKRGVFASLDKLKSLRGRKHKYEINDEVDNVYDYIEESEFQKYAKEKYGEDWIEDDGTGYLEDGRDFFEDEDNFSDEDKHRKTSKSSKKRERDNEKARKGSGSIRNLLSNVSKKKKVVDLNADDDALLNILGELDSEKPEKKDPINEIAMKSINAKFRVSVIAKEDVADLAKTYLQSFKSGIKKIEKSEKETKVSAEALATKIAQSPKKKQNLIHDNLSEVLINTPIGDIEDEVDSLKENVEKKNLSPKKVEEKAETTTRNIQEIQKISIDREVCTISNNENVNEKLAKEAFKESKDITKVDDDHLLSNWESICKMDAFEQETTLVPNKFDEQDLSDSNIKFWLWDAWEDAQKRPGQIFLFGKLYSKQGVGKSVCVQIENVERILYLLPREYLLDSVTKEKTAKKVSLLDVYHEFEENIAADIGLLTFRSRKVQKKFAFHVPGVDVPGICDYMEIRYDGNKPSPNIKKTYNSIAHIFGANTSPLEIFLLERKIKGPCWLNVQEFKINNHPISWCKVEGKCHSINCISVAEERSNNPPPMSIFAINIRTALNPKNMKNEIVMISCLVNSNFRVDKPPSNPPFNKHCCGYTRPIVQNWPFDLPQKSIQYKLTKITRHDTERALLSWFLAYYQGVDPDLIVTYDANDCQLDSLCDRIANTKIQHWSRIGRLKMTQLTGKRYKDFFIGRMVCDVKKSAEEFIKSRSYDLDTLCTNVLKIKEGERMDISNDKLYNMYEKSEELLKLITLTMQDCSYILRLMCELNVLPLALQITNICGNLMSRTLQGGRSERNEFLLLHAFNEKDYIVPDKKTREINWDNPDTETNLTQTATRKKAAYSGGLVLDPIKGFYDKYILLMDFNSLYPSIIQEYNICFTTINEPEKNEEMPALPDSTVEQGILPRQIRRLVESRREVKKLMANPDLGAEQKMQYNIRQLALKLTANSMYGCLGFTQSRFFAQHLAALITYKGREILMNTKSLVQKLNYEVVYGDTDSIMVNTNCTDYDQVFTIGQNIKQAVNKIYKQIELDIDGVFKYLLLLKKKKYAAKMVSKNKSGELEYTQEYKGLDIVRRDWSQISVMAGRAVLDEILSDNPLDEKIENIHAYLEKFKQDILDGSVPLQLLTITKQLTKAAKDYTTINTLPHVQVALRMNSTRNTRYKKGDMISYIICEDGTENPPMQRAYHLEEIKSNEKLKVDTNYYLAQQIHPVVSRLCEPLEGTDASRIASCLGLDPNKFKVTAQKVARERMDEDVGVSIVKSTVEKFRHCNKFKFSCAACKTENLVAAAFKPGDHTPVLQKCSNSECSTAPYQYIASIRNQLILSMRMHIKDYYENWMICDDPTCNSNTRIYAHVIVNNRPVCSTCKQGLLIKQYSERDLFHQLNYYQYMFDISKYKDKNVNISPELETAYDILKEAVDQQLAVSGYYTVSLSDIFGALLSDDAT